MNNSWLHSVLGILILFSSITVNAAITSKVSPNPGYADDTFTFSVDFGTRAGNEYVIKLQLGNGEGGWLGQDNMIASANRETFTLAKKITKPGNRLYRYVIYKNGSFVGRNPVSGSHTYTVKEKERIQKPSAPNLQSPANSAAVSGTSQTLDWNSVSGATSYELALRNDTLNQWVYGGSQPVKNTTSSNTTVSGLTEGYRYVWTVQAKNSAGISASSIPYYFTVKERIQAPSKPTPQSPANNAEVSGTSQALDWSSVSGATGYELALRNDTLNQWVYGGSQPVKSTTSPNTTVSGLTEGYRYVWTVQAKNSAGISASSIPYYFTVKERIQAPSKPTPQSPANNAEVSGTSQALNWSSVSGATGYELALRNDTLNQWVYGGSQPVKNTTSSNTTVSGLTEGYRYVWTVQAKNSAGISASSIPYYFTVQERIQAPSKPTPQSPANNAEVSGTSQALDWSSVSGATGYELALRNDTLNQWVYGGSQPVKNTTSSNTTVSGLTEGYRYVWTVQAKNSAGISASSIPYYFTVQERIQAPSKPTPQSPANNAEVSGTSQALDWSSVSGATGYELALRNDTLNQWVYGGSQPVKNTTSSNTTVSGLTEGYRYVWTVQAKNSAGLSASSIDYHFTITKPVSHTPTLALINTPVNQIELDTNYSIRLSVNDNDGNLKNLEINWGDSPTEIPESINLSGTTNTQTYSHTYRSAGTYTWTAIAIDHTDQKSSTIFHTISVNEKPVTTNQLRVIRHGQGNVVGSGISCGVTSGFTDCTHTFSKTIGTLSLKANPLDGAIFDSWNISSGCQIENQTPTTGGGSDLRYRMTADCQITANFSALNALTPPVFQSGSASSTNDGLAGDNFSFVAIFKDADNPYIVGVEVYIKKEGDIDGPQIILQHDVTTTQNTQRFIGSTAINDAGEYEYRFRAEARNNLNQSGVYSNWSPIQKFTVGERSQSVELTVRRKGNGNILSIPYNRIDCGVIGVDCKQIYTKGSAVNLIATAVVGWEFDKWEGTLNCTTSTTCSFSIDENVDITAHFIESNTENTEPRVIDFNPKQLLRYVETEVTIKGINLPNTMVAGVWGSRNSCQQATYTSTEVKFSCVADTKPKTVPFYVKSKSDLKNTTVFKGSENWHINVLPEPNSPPLIHRDLISYPNISTEGKTAYISTSVKDSDNNLASVQIYWGGGRTPGKKHTFNPTVGKANVDFGYQLQKIDADYGSISFRIVAKDDSGAETTSGPYVIQVRPKSISQPVAEIKKTGSNAEEYQKNILSDCAQKKQKGTNPIVLASGAKVENKLLLSTHGIVEVNFSIRYNSLIRGISSVGQGWDFDNAKPAKIIEDASTGNVTLLWSTQQQHEFTKNTDNTYSAKSYGCRLDTLTKLDDGGFKVERRGRDVYIFDNKYFLQRIENFKGQGLYYEYNHLSQLARVSKVSSER